MNRRNFLKSLVTGLVGLTIAPTPTTLFEDFVDTTKVGDFEYYITYTWKMYVMNPRAVGFIVNIEE